MQYFEPVSRLDFCFLQTDLAAHPIANERNHQRVRKRPRLTREVANVVYSHADFFADFALDTLLERLAGLDEAGERAVHARGKVRAAPEEKLILPAHEHHHRRRHSRVRRELARRTAAYPLLSLCHRRRAAAPAELVRAIPIDKL